MKEVRPEALPEQFQRLFPGRRFVVVSNREPYEHVYNDRDGSVTLRRPAGGLISAIDPMLQAVGGSWVAWGSGEADREVSDEAGRIGVPPEEPRYTLQRIWLDQRDVEEYYFGYANQVLWPLCHMRPSLTRIRARHFARYISVNKRFAEAVLQTAQDPLAIWFQDYHLALAPAYVRARRADVTSAHFWHIPFPPPDVFRVATRAPILLDGLLANDLVGFHLPAFCANFLRCVQQMTNAEVDWESRCVRIGKHTCWVRALPISIDIDEFERAAQPNDAAARLKRMRHRFAPNGERLGVGVDRVDYSKGLEEKFKALDFLWARNPELRERFTFVQVAVPSRTDIEAYDRLNEKIERMAWSINERYGTDTWTPVRLVKESLPPERLALLYRLADVCIVSSLQDGMNLVAKEFVASQVDHSGVLLLSKFAGAVEELSGCVPINPYDPEACADQIREALNMRHGERRARMQKMRGDLRSIYDWLGEGFALWGAAAAGEDVPLSRADNWS